MARELELEGSLGAWNTFGHTCNVFCIYKKGHVMIHILYFTSPGCGGS